MAFKQYQNKSSTLKRFSRYIQGGTSDVKKKKVGWWERRDIEKNQPDDIVIYSLPKCYENSPSLLAYDVYGRDDLVWLILQYNNIVDVIEEFTTGSTITLPSKNRLMTSILTRNINFNVGS